MKESFKYLKGNRGSGIMTVMLAVLFLTAFGTLALYLTYTSFQVATSDRYSKEVTYNANTCMEEVKAGLQDIVSYAIEETYKEVMPHYTKNAGNITKEFAEKYFEKIIQTKDKENRQYITLNILKTTDEDGNEIPIGYADYGVYDINAITSLIKEKRDKNNTVEVFSSAGTNNVEVKKNGDDLPTSIILKGINVKFTGRGGRSSVVTADIKIGVPNIGYLLTQYAITGFPEFTLISNGALTQDKEAESSITVEGSAYADSIELNNNGQMKVRYNSTLICKNGIMVNGGPTVSTSNLFEQNMKFMVDNSSTLWAGDIKVGDQSSVSLKGNTYVANDLKLNGYKSIAFISGKYHGFGSSVDIPTESSSIISNGLESVLSIERVSQLTLAGVSFVDNEQRSDYNDWVDGKKGVRMGESISGKDNQRLYFAPAGSVTWYKTKLNEAGYEENYTGHFVKTDEMHRHTYYEKVNGDYVKIENADEEYRPISEGIKLEGSKSKRLILTQAEFNATSYFAFNTANDDDIGKPFSDYGITLKPIYQPYPANNTVIVYFFVAFEDQEKANKFFIDYFTNSKDDVTRWFNAYITSDITGTMFRSFPRTTVGSFYSDFDSDTHDLINPITIDLESIERIRNESQFVSDIFKNYCTTLTNKVVEKDPEKPYTYANNPFDYYIDSGKIKNAFKSVFPNYESDGDSVTHTMGFYNKDTLTAIVTDGTYNYTGDNPSIHLIIAFGEKAKVNVTGTFKGLIICNKEVIVSGNAIFSSDADSVLAAFLADNLADEPIAGTNNYNVKEGNYKIKDFFNIDILEQYENSLYSTGDAWNVAELVTFDSWSRK